MNKTEKEKEVASLHEIFAGAQNAVLVDFTGITVAEAELLRNKIRDGNSSFRVVKNRLALRATAETPLEPLNEHFRGATGVAWNGEDPVVLSKSVVEFAKEIDRLKVKAGVIEGKPATEAEVKKVAALPSRDDLIFQFYYVLQSPLRRLVTALNWNVQQFAQVLNAVKDKKEQ